MDYGNYLDVRLEPGTGATKRVFVAIYESFSRAGGSLDVAGKLPAVYEANSLAVTAVETLTAVATPGDPLWKWVREFLRLYLPALASSGDLTRGDIDECTAEWDELERTDGTVLYLPPVLGVVGRKVS
jgi:hypothetical protein